MQSVFRGKLSKNALSCIVEEYFKTFLDSDPDSVTFQNLMETSLSVARLHLLYNNEDMISSFSVNLLTVIQTDSQTD